jgi:topoisomerase-4 subunit A
MLDPLPYEVPEEIIPERRITNDDGTDFQLDEDGQINLFYF